MLNSMTSLPTSSFLVTAMWQQCRIPVRPSGSNCSTCCTTTLPATSSSVPTSLPAASSQRHTCTQSRQARPRLPESWQSATLPSRSWTGVALHSRLILKPDCADQQMQARIRPKNRQHAHQCSDMQCEEKSTLSQNLLCLKVAAADLACQHCDSTLHGLKCAVRLAIMCCKPSAPVTTPDWPPSKSPPNTAEHWSMWTLQHRVSLPLCSTPS